MMKDFIIKAYDFYKKAVLEYERGNKEKDNTLLRNACEKGWGAVREATNALFHKLNFKPIPRSNRDRRIAFDSLKKKNGKIRELRLSDQFSARCFKLYERGCYDSVLSPEEIEIELEKEFIELVEVT